jgi:hypothetical protein
MPGGAAEYQNLDKIYVKKAFKRCDRNLTFIVLSITLYGIRDQRVKTNQA